MQFTNLLIAGTAMAGAALAQTSSGPQVATPQTLMQCKVYQILLSGGSPPYDVYATERGNPSAVIERITTTSSSTYSWTVNIQAGNVITLYVVDSTGASNSAAPSNSIGASGDSSCNPIAATAGAGNTSGGSASSGGSTTAGSSSGSTTSAAAGGSGGSTTRANTSSSSSSSRAQTTSAGSSSSSSGTNDAPMKLSGFSATVAGVVGVVVAALF